MFQSPEFFTSFYVYEREQRWPWGHRNVVFAKRGGPIVYISRGLYKNSPWHDRLPVKNSPREISPQELWQVLRKDGRNVTVISHTGATGMGKSTTLATMIEEVNRIRKAKIITIEDPIEFVFTHDQSIITQREIGTDTASFPEALRAALRQDPDVIMVGEMRDLETVDTSLKAAETGHLVFSSIHTSNVAATISRLVSFFPPEEQLQVRARLAENLAAIVSLRLLPNKKQDDRVPAVEMMQATRSIQECIKDPNKAGELAEYIARGRSELMQTFDQHLLDLLHANKISIETAMGAATNPTDFKTKLALEGGVGPDEEIEEQKSEEPFEIKADERF